MAMRNIDKFIRWNEKAKMYEPVMWRRDVLPSWITFVETSQLPVTIPAAATGLSLRVTMEQPYTSLNGMDRGLGTPFEVRSLVFSDATDGTPAANFTVQMKEIGETREFMNQPIHVRTMFGTGQQPAILREPFLFLSKHNLGFTLTKVAGGATAVRMYGAGAQYYPWSPGLVQNNEKAGVVDLLKKWVNRRRYVTPFWLTSEQPVALPGTLNASLDATIKMGDDGQFEAFGHAVVATGNFGFVISEVKTGQTLMNGVVSAVNGAGDARFPTIYPIPYMIPAGYRMNIRFTNLTAAPNSIFWTFFGRRCYVPFNQVQEVLQDTAVPTPADTPTLMVPAPLE